VEADAQDSFVKRIEKYSAYGKAPISLDDQVSN
jgi:hypothetical protein